MCICSNHFQSPFWSVLLKFFYFLNSFYERFQKRIAKKRKGPENFLISPFTVGFYDSYVLCSGFVPGQASCDSATKSHDSLFLRKLILLVPDVVPFYYIKQAGSLDREQR